jgi:2-keto-4-pentenoate hydratase/2-oxohepta-3-ene-1,7-dioic acid hydratase in catechol pathway
MIGRERCLGKKDKTLKAIPRYGEDVKVARFSHSGNEPRFGIVDGDDLVVLAGDPMFHGWDTTGERVALSDAQLLAPVIPRSKVICVGMNYAAHAKDMAHEGPDNPLIFLKPNTAIVGPGDPIVIPPVEGRIVHEGELAVVIGSVAKRVKKEDWKSVVFGYTIANDVSARDVMFADGQWARAKGYDTFCPLGPWIDTEIDPSDLLIETFVDGEPRRTGSTSDLIYSIPDIIEFCSDVWTLLPGDVILTGTPSGLGGFVAGQDVEIRIQGIGSLINPAVNRDDRADS